MKLNLKKLFAAITLLAAVIGTSSSVRATTLDSTYLLGYVVDGSPANYGAELGYLNNLLLKYDGGVPSADGHTYTLNVGSNVPAAPVSQPVQNDGLLTIATGSAVNVSTDGYLWLVGKWADSDAIFYIGGLTTFTLPSNLVIPGAKGNGTGLSGYSLHGAGGSNVPDGGTTAVLLGLGLVGMSFVARRRMVA